MGGFYGSIQVKSEDRQRVIEIAEQVAREMRIHMLAGPASGGWVGLYPEHNGQDDKVGRVIAERMGGWALHLLVHDDDIFAYWLYREGRVIDAFWSMPGYFGEENRAAEQAMMGNPQAFAPIIGERVKELPPYLVRGLDGPVFAGESLEGFAKVLNIANAVTAYEYLKEGETEGVLGWRQFIEIPRDVVIDEKKQKRRASNAYRNQVRRLKSAGLLLLHESRKKLMPRACAMGKEFLAAWPDYRGSVEFAEYRPPWDGPAPIALDCPAHITEFASDASKRRVAASAGQSVRVWDVEGGQSKQIADIPESDLAIAIAITADGTRIAHLSRQEIVLSDVASGRRLLGVPAAGFQRLAIHPDGRWIAAAGKTVALISCDDTPALRTLFVGGKANIASIVGPLVRTKLQAMDLPEIERQARARIDSVLDTIIEAGRAKKQPMTDEQMAEVRQSMDKSIADMHARFAAIREGGAEFPPPQGKVRVANLGFTHDGRWMWCGTESGLQVFEWSAVPREAGAQLLGPTWNFAPPARVGVAYSQQVFAVAEDPGAAALVFGDNAGRIYRIDLTTGQTRELASLPTQAGIYGLAISADGQALGITADPGRTERGMQQGIWEIWSYPKLLSG